MFLILPSGLSLGSAGRLGNPVAEHPSTERRIRHSDKSQGVNVSLKLGFICAKCQTRFQVARTVNPCHGRVVCYRKCPKCGRNIVTEERERVQKLSISGASS